MNEKTKIWLAAMLLAVSAGAFAEERPADCVRQNSPETTGFVCREGGHVSHLVSADEPVRVEGIAAFRPENKYTLWYTKPATNWMTSCLPIGNGQFGATLMGQVAVDDVQFNDKTLWSGKLGGLTSTADYGSYLNFGNLFIAAMAEVTGDMEEALKKSSKVLAVKGRVLPASTAHVRLDAVMEDGTLVEGESHIPEAHKHIRRVKLFPEHVEPVESALAAIREADVVILGPGSLYTSIMPNLLVDGVAEALKKSRALKIYICNVLTQPGETDGYTAAMHAKAILDHAGRGAIDYMLVNATPLPHGTAQLLKKEGVEPVAIDEDAINALGIGVVKADLVNDDDVAHHDPEKLMKSVMKMAYKLHPGIGK